jgi:hypothetical protein
LPGQCALHAPLRLLYRAGQWGWRRPRGGNLKRPAGSRLGVYGLFPRLFLWGGADDPAFQSPLGPGHGPGVPRAASSPGSRCERRAPAARVSSRAGLWSLEGAERPLCGPGRPRALDKTLCRCACLTTRAVARKALKAGRSHARGCVNTRLALQPGRAYGQVFSVGESGELESQQRAVPLAQCWDAQAQGFRTGLIVHRCFPEKP